MNARSTTTPRPLDRRRRWALRTCRVIVTVASLSLISTLGACQTSVVSVGQDGRAASYSFGTLMTDLGPEVSVLTAAAAAEKAMAMRGYAVMGRFTTERESRLTGEYAGAADRNAAEIHIFTLHTGIRIRITVKPLGDLAESQALMDATLAQLGK
jgi:hypothetical protein